VHEHGCEHDRQDRRLLLPASCQARAVEAGLARARLMSGVMTIASHSVGGALAKSYMLAALFGCPSGLGCSWSGRGYGSTSPASLVPFLLIGLVIAGMLYWQYRRRRQ